MRELPCLNSLLGGMLFHFRLFFLFFCFLASNFIFLLNKEEHADDASDVAVGDLLVREIPPS